jgi:predicted GIY-YIG superfamily endonuclease
MSEKSNYCYILYNDQNNLTYNGYTNDLNRRLRQHNCEIKGGAKFTTNICIKRQVKWKFLAIISSLDPDFSQKKALSLEWSIKYPDNKRPRPRAFNSPQGRLEGLEKALLNPKFAEFLFVKEDFLHNTKSMIKNGEVQDDIDLMKHVMTPVSAFQDNQLSRQNETLVITDKDDSVQSL